MTMLVCAVQGNIDYIPQIIGVIGTILGTILGWLLHHLSENTGKINIGVDNFENVLSKQNEFAYILKLFVYNSAMKSQCMRNVKISFCDNKRHELIKSIPNIGECSFNTIRGKNEKKENDIIITLGGYIPDTIILSDLLEGTIYDELKKVNKIYLIYEDKKSKIKKKLIHKDFCLCKVNYSNWEYFP